MSGSTDLVGRVLSGRYRLIAPVGAGASARVYLADDVRLKRRVAVKVLHDALADDESFLRRFRAEAQAAAALNHPNIVAVYDWGDDDGTPYIVTEYLGGGSLRSLFDRGVRLTTSQALLLGLETSRALDYAHRRGFVHRDIKPANLLFGEDGRMRIADFGLARALAEAAWTEPQGAVLGTARYASPEQAQGQSVDGRADVYSLGLVLIEAVTGSVPFTADTTIATLMARVGRPVEVPDAMGPLKEVLERVGQPEVADRPDAGQLGVALMAIAGDLPRPEPLSLAAGHDPTLVVDPGDATVIEAASDSAGPAPIFLDDDLLPDRRRRRRWPWVVLAVLLAAGLGGAGALLISNARTPSFAVPPLVSLTEAQARNNVAQYGWKIAIDHARQDGSYVGEVLATRPAPPAKLKKGRTLTLVVSDGNTLATVPTDLVGQTLAAATAELRTAGGFTPKPTDVFDEQAPVGTITKMGPGVAAQLPKGSAVAVQVSKGPQPRTVPSGLAGGTFAQAQASLATVQLVANQVPTFSDTVPVGQVIGTNPAAGTAVARGGSVDVQVSKGPQPVAVPNVKGLSLDAATAALTNAGFVPGNVSGKASGKVKGTNPPIGSLQPKGTTIDLMLG
jgi:beta-lactam-binding protein with PASTA domain/tRNA A-37 threonylcarbamoyl transferase component Bud32